MQFILTGFRQHLGIRIFSFEGIGEDRTRTAFSVRTDVALTRSYGIRLQELPLLCREFLDQQDDGSQKRSFTYTEADMRLYASNRAAALDKAVQKRKLSRQPAGGHVGAS